MGLQLPFHQSPWAIATGLKSRGYPFSATICISRSSNPDNDTLDMRIEYNFSIPLQLQYQGDRWHLSGGLEFKKGILDEDDDLLLPKYTWSEIGFSFGIEYFINPVLSISGSIYSANNFWANRRLNSNLYHGFSNALSLKYYILK